MKKIYLGVIMASISFGGVCQNISNATLLPKSKLAQEEQKGLITTNFVSKAQGTVVWENSFDTPADSGAWVINNDGQTGDSLGWAIDTVTRSWYFRSTKINSTSGGNFASLVNKNTTTPATNVTYTMTLANPIDLSTNPLVELSFEEYGARFNDLQEVQVSTDGTNFKTVANNLQKEVLSVSGGSAYTNPTLRTVNITDSIATNPSSVWIRFSWTTNFPQSTNTGAWITYGWFIDDVKITTLPDNNLTVINDVWGAYRLNYNQIPNTQVSEIFFNTVLKNNGINDQTNVKLNVNITGQETQTLQSSPKNIASGTQDTASIDPGFTPNGSNGTYNFTWNITQDATDDFTADNTLQGGTFTVNDYIYARDLGNPDGTEDNGDNGFETGNFFVVNNTQNVYSIDARINQDTRVGAQVYAKIYRHTGYSNGSLVLESVDESDYYTIKSSDIGNFVNFDLNGGPSGTELTENTRYLVVVGTDGGQENKLVISTSGKSYRATSWILNQGDPRWYYLNNTPMVRMNFDPTSNNVGVEENTLQGVSIYPNPTSGMITISNDNQTKNTIEVRDLTGKVVATTSASTQTSIDLTGNAAGVYIVKVYNENGSKIEKVTLR